MFKKIFTNPKPPIFLALTFVRGFGQGKRMKNFLKFFLLLTILRVKARKKKNKSNPKKEERICH